MNQMKWIFPLLAALTAVPCQAEITSKEFDHLFRVLLPPEAEAGWLSLDWETDLWAARQRAAKEGKPIFLWEMDGHPLGCT